MIYPRGRSSSSPPSLPPSDGTSVRYARRHFSLVAGGTRARPLPTFANRFFSPACSSPFSLPLSSPRAARTKLFEPNRAYRCGKARTAVARAAIFRKFPFVAREGRKSGGPRARVGPPSTAPSPLPPVSTRTSLRRGTLARSQPGIVRERRRPLHYASVLERKRASPTRPPLDRASFISPAAPGGDLIKGILLTERTLARSREKLETPRLLSRCRSLI